MNVRCKKCQSVAYLAPGGYEIADQWMRDHALSCYSDPNPVGKFESQATKGERNPERYQDRTLITGNYEPARIGITRRIK